MSKISYFTDAFLCFECNQNQSYEIIQTIISNKNIENFNRFYYKCKTSQCNDSFFCFDDYRDIFDDNLSCHCERFFQRIVAKKNFV